MIAQRLKIVITRFVYVILFRPNLKVDLIRLGSDYGGWWVPTEGLNSNSICYLAGVGTHISFDQALIERLGCTVWAMDPTPKSRRWFEHSFGQLELFNFMPYGVAGASGSVKFYTPANPCHVSHSMKNLQRTDTFFVAEVKTVRQVMSSLNHQSIDLIKLDIEGAEHDTLRTMIADEVRPYVICVEFDQPEPVGWALTTVKMLKSSGYGLAKVERFNLTFILR